MAGMGAYSRKRTFTPEGPEAFTKGIAQLLGLQNRSLQQVGESVDDYGKSKATGKLAELMGSEGFGAMTPEQAQAAAMEATGGRTMNENGNTMLEDIMSNKQKVLDNTNKETAATTLFNRNVKRDATRDANSMARTKESKKGGVLSPDMQEKLFSIQQRAIGLNKTIDDVDSSPMEREAARGQLLKDSIEMETTIKGSGFNAGAAENIAKQTMPKTVAKSKEKLFEVKYPEAYKRVAQRQTPAQQKATNANFKNNMITVIPGTQVEDKNGNKVWTEDQFKNAETGEMIAQQDLHIPIKSKAQIQKEAKAKVEAETKKEYEAWKKKKLAEKNKK